MNNPLREFMILILIFVFIIISILAFIYSQIIYGLIFVVFILVLFLRTELVGVLLSSLQIRLNRDKMNKYIAWRLYEIGVDGWGTPFDDIMKPLFEKPTDLPDYIIRGVEKTIKREQTKRRANWEDLRQAGQDFRKMMDKHFSSTEKTD